jgi:hypothetical protein
MAKKRASAKQIKQRKRFKAASVKANRLYKSGKYNSYGEAMKAALSGKAPKKYRQTGGSDKKRDEERKAKPPGKRKTTSRGKTTYYYERRKNRSDVPGRLSGGSNGSSSHNEMLLRNLSERNRNLQTGESTLIQLMRRYTATPKGIEKRNLKRQITEQKKYLKVIKSEIRMLRGLLK